MTGSTKVVHVYVRPVRTYYCDSCGARCETTKRVDRPYSPSVCRACALERQRVVVRGLFKSRTRAT